MSFWERLQAKTRENKYYRMYRRSGLYDRFSFDDFLYYRMQTMEQAQREEILSISELETIEKQLNDDAKRDVFNDKRKFYARFASYIHREIRLLENMEFDEFLRFVKQQGRVIVKPPLLYAGQGVEMLLAQQVEDNRYWQDNFFAKKEAGYVAETYVVQKETYQKIYRGCLNTVRIMTFVKKDGTPMVLAAANQFGSGGSVVDNDDLTGIWASINVETGIVEQVETDPFTSIVRETHPDTGEKILGFMNEDFALMKEVALKAALEEPTCRLIGWDMAVTPQGVVEIIEGNVTPEIDLFQTITGKGFRSFFAENL